MSSSNPQISDGARPLRVWAPGPSRLPPHPHLHDSARVCQGSPGGFPPPQRSAHKQSWLWLLALRVTRDLCSILESQVLALRSGLLKPSLWVVQRLEIMHPRSFASRLAPNSHSTGSSGSDHCIVLRILGSFQNFTSLQKGSYISSHVHVTMPGTVRNLTGIK